MQIKLRYFALLREEAKKSHEIIETHAVTAREVFNELRQRYAFSLDENLLKVSINQQYANWDQPLQDRDEVVFIPPVAGG